MFIICFYSLDPEQKDCLIEVIEKLLKDKTTVRNYLKPEMESLHLTSCVFIYLHDVILVIAFTALQSIKRREGQEQETFFFTTEARMPYMYMLFSVESSSDFFNTVYVSLHDLQ